jgi:phospholipid-binding lipoprotein MlaA
VQPFNRKVFRLNREVDRIVLKPAADVYVKITPKPIRTALSHFFDNANYPDTMLNQFLQGKFKEGFSDTARFVVNSTVGVLGLFDVATRMGLPEHQEDFGQTLGVWGVGEGMYGMLPVLGPTTARDVPHWPVTAVTNVLYYVHNPVVTIPLSVLGALDQRARVGGAFEFIDVAAVDPYIFVREGYRQRRTFLIYDGHPPVPSFEEELNEALPPEQGEGAEPGKAPESKAAKPDSTTH